MNQANKIWGLTESLAIEPATVKVSITPETGKRKKSQKSDLGDIEKEFWQEWSAIRDQLYRCCLKGCVTRFENPWQFQVIGTAL